MLGWMLLGATRRSANKWVAREKREHRQRMNEQAERQRRRAPEPGVEQAEPVEGVSTTMLATAILLFCIWIVATVWLYGFWGVWGILGWVAGCAYFLWTCVR